MSGQGFLYAFKDLIDGSNPVDFAQKLLRLVKRRNRKSLTMERFQPLADRLLVIVGAGNDLRAATIAN